MEVEGGNEMQPVAKMEDVALPILKKRGHMGLK
jgi:hypothetical protein